MGPTGRGTQRSVLSPSGWAREQAARGYKARARERLAPHRSRASPGNRVWPHLCLPLPGLHLPASSLPPCSQSSSLSQSPGLPSPFPRISPSGCFTATSVETLSAGARSLRACRQPGFADREPSRSREELDTEPGIRVPRDPERATQPLGPSALGTLINVSS